MDNVLRPEEMKFLYWAARKGALAFNMKMEI
jgi:hypothetical protein